MATTISTQDIIDAKRDIDDIGRAVNEKVIVSPRYGEDFKSLPMIAEEFQISSDAAEAAAVSAAESSGIATSAAQDASSSANIAEAAATAATIGAGVFETPGVGVDPVTGVADGAYFNVRSPNDESYVDEYQNIGGVPTPSGKSYPSSVAVRNIAKYTALPFVAGKTYGLHERVQLENGNIVKSTIDGNTNNPNTDMTGWFLIGSDKITIVESVNDLSGIAKWDGRIVETKSYYAPNFALASPYRGGSKYIYNALRASENDGFSCISGWVQLADTLTFDSCGVYVDDSTKRTFNTTRITAILTYAINNKKPVSAEVGRYYANTVSLDRVNFDSTAFNLAGQGKKKTIFDFAIELVSSSTTTGSAYSLRWQHVKFNGFYLNPTTSVRAALTLQRVGMIYGDDVDISYSGTGFKLRGGSEVFFKNCDIYSCFRGLDLHSATDGVNGGIEIDFAVVSFDNCNISNCTKHEIYKARSLYFNGGNFNANQSDSAYFYDSQLISFKDVSIESSKKFVFTNCSNIQLDKSLMGLNASDKFVLINSTVTDNASVWEGGVGQIKLDATSQYISKSIAIYYPTFNVDHTNANLSNITFDFLPQNALLLSNSIFTRKSHYPITMNSANYTFSNSNANYLKTGNYYIECTVGVVMLIPINSDFAGFEIIGKQIPVPELHTGSASLGALVSRGIFTSVQTLGELRRYVYAPSPNFKNLITVGGQLYIAFSLFNGSVIDSIKVFTTSKAYSNSINRVTNTSTVTIAASSKTVVTYSVSGAVLGDRVNASVNQDITNVTVRAWVSAADVVSVEFSNLTASSITLTCARVSVDVS